MSDRLELLQVRPGICFGRLDDVFLLFYRDAPTVDDLRARIPMIDRLVRQHPAGVAFLSVIDTTEASVMPDAASRAETERQVDRVKDTLRAGAVVLEGNTVRTTLMRTVLRGVLLLKRDAGTFRFFDDPGEAAAWCLEELQVDAVARHRRRAEIVSAVDAMRQAAGEPSPTELSEEA